MIPVAVPAYFGPISGRSAGNDMKVGIIVPKQNPVAPSVIIIPAGCNNHAIAEQTVTIKLKINRHGFILPTFAIRTVPARDPAIFPTVRAAVNIPAV